LRGHSIDIPQVVVRYVMVDLKVAMPEKWAKYLKSLGEEHQIDLTVVISELWEWSLSNSEGKTQFEDWLDEAYP
jgi:hypothetical protein